MKQAIGYYNELEYRVEVDSKEVYTAGNSHFDSQGYVDTDEGVGLDVMKQYCEQTTRNIALEHKAQYIGVEYLELD